MGEEFARQNATIITYQNLKLVSESRLLAIISRCPLTSADSTSSYLLMAPLRHDYVHVFLLPSDPDKNLRTMKTGAQQSSLRCYYHRSCFGFLGYERCMEWTASGRLPRLLFDTFRSLVPEIRSILRGVCLCVPCDCINSWHPVQ